MSRTRIRIMALLAVTALSHPAFAADAVSVRTGAHDGYTRLVFQWPANTSYTLKQAAPGQLTITFPRAAKLDTSQLEPDSNIKAVRQTSPGDAPLALEITTPPGGKFRDFGAGDKVIIDVYGATGGAQTAKPVPEKKPVPKPDVKKPEPEKATKAPPAKMSAPKTEAKAETQTPPAPAHETKAKSEPPSSPPAEPVKPANVPSSLAPSTPAAVTGDNIITLASTETSGMAAFTRGGWLWLVKDRPANDLPQLAGPDKDRFGAFERIPMTGGSAWRIKLPGPALNVYGDGGGLVWRVTVTPKTRESHETELERKLQPGGSGSLVWPVQANTILEIKDPSVGDILKVVTVAHADQNAGAPYSFVELQTLPSIVGLAIEPRTDDLKVERGDKDVEIKRPAGLSLSSARDVSLRMMAKPDAEAKPTAVTASVEPAVPAAAIQPFFDFNRWMMGGPSALRSNEIILLSGMKTKETDARVQDLVTLAKMNLANDRGPEALGFLSLAEDELPAVAEGGEFIALRGVAEALSGKSELAFHDLQSPTLLGNGEIDYWRAMALAELGDWQQAAKTMPADLSILLRYPQPLLEKMLPKMAEIALRAGDAKKADALLGALSKEPSLMPSTQAAVDYLQGQSDVQKNHFDEAQKLWKPLLTSSDNLFRVRAGLALTLHEVDKKLATPAQASDRLEGLRYAWRGDGLEAQINFELGKLYLQQRQYLKAFTIMRDAAGMSPDADIAHEINAYMADSFKNLLMNDKTISSLDSVAVYEEFHELAPAGDDGNKLVQKLAERLVSTDLLGRAGDLLQGQIDYSLQGAERAQVALRLAAIALLNKDPQRALGALDKSEAFYRAMPASAEKDKSLHAIALMRARALSQSGKTEDALGMLGKMGKGPDVSRLRAEIAWQAGLWPDAADALQDMIVDENIDNSKPLTDPQADLILNRAVALNLGGDRVELGNMLKRYGDRMKATKRASLFEVVTRPHSINVMAEQQTIQSIVSEVDMFKGFLDEYKGSAGQSLNATQ